MNLLKGDIIKNGIIVKSSAVPYDNNSTDFFIALVTISDNLNVDIPIWTLKEDRGLEKNSEVIIPLKDDVSLKIYVHNEMN